MSENKLIITSVNHHIFTLTLNRPELHNAFNEEVIYSLTEALKKAEADAEVRVVILAANGKSFCAGADLGWMRKMVDYSYEENIADAKALADLMQILANLSKPTIALVQGAAYGGGVGLIACCDIAIASETATFCFSETKLGLVPAIISPYIIQAMGVRAARRYFLTAEIFDVQEAYRLGLIHQITSAHLLMDTGWQMAQSLLNNSPQALQETKGLLGQLNQSMLNDKIITKTIDCIARIRVSAEGQEGINAFLEKKQPHWKKSLRKP